MTFTMLREITLGDMTARYVLEEESGQLELQLLPAGLEAPVEPRRQRREPQGLIQAYLTGEESPRGYGNGVTLNQSGTVKALRLAGQECRREGDAVETVTVLEHPTGCRFTHHLAWDGKRPYLTVWTEAEQRGGTPVSLELLTSFSLGGLSPRQEGPASGQLWLHRLRSGWSMEARLCSERLEALNLEPSWARHGIRRERFGQVGSMAVNQWYPWMALEDRRDGIIWGCRLAHPASWQMEVLRQDDAVALTGGLADYLYGHWRKTLGPGERLESPRAYLTVCRGGTVDDAARRLVRVLDGAVPAEPLPLFFNEYCTTWGVPSEASVAEQLACLRGKGVTHFVMDAGWYKPEHDSWEDALGDYQVSRELFPGGIEKTVAAIRAEGLIPRIWFEPETVGKTARAYGQTDHLLKRDGAVITTPTRRFWDFRDAWVWDYLRKRMTAFLREKGFGYVKVDYNDTVGLGCDGAESLGEGLRQHMEAVQAFYRALRAETPGLQMELCASGGHRLEPAMLELFEFASFSDAHECLAIPIVAANLHRVVPPAQLQIWAVLRKEDGLNRIGYSLCAAMLGAMCVSGDITCLSAEQWRAVDAGLAFYRRAEELIRRGVSFRFGPEILSYDSPVGWQGVLRVGEAGEALLILHQFGGRTEPVSIPWTGTVEAVYDCAGSEITCTGGAVRWKPAAELSATAVLLRR